MKASHITFSVDGHVTAKEIELRSFTRAAIFRHLKLEKLSPMDVVKRLDDGSLCVEIAEDKPWTWTRHVFVAVNN